MNQHILLHSRLVAVLGATLGAAIAALASPAALAGFDWGTDCADGEGTFDQQVPYRQLATVGEIPAHRRNVEVSLNADTDVDVQLIDIETGHQIIAWPDGDLNGPTENCTDFHGVRYCYSGYNGVDGNRGHETITILGDTNRPLLMRVFGYEAGQATVDYNWIAMPTCHEVGDGAFEQHIPFQDSTLIGELAPDTHNVTIELKAEGGRDLDIRLFDGDTALIKWPDGQLNGPNEQVLEYEGMTLTYSGYNGIDGDLGHERIIVTGRISKTLRMEAFGYQSGNAHVSYSWGYGVGKICGGIAGFPCKGDLVCKEMSPLIPDSSGSCHVENWCYKDANRDCSNLMHIATPGTWTCESFTCKWHSTRPPMDACGMPLNTQYVSHDANQCPAIHYLCKAGTDPFSNACGCGCDAGLLFQ